MSLWGLIGPTPLWLKVYVACEAALSGERVMWVQARGTTLPGWAQERLLESGVVWVCLCGGIQGRIATLTVIDEVEP
jgi:hypothetical protein